LTSEILNFTADIVCPFVMANKIIITILVFFFSPAATGYALEGVVSAEGWLACEAHWIRPVCSAEGSILAKSQCNGFSFWVAHRC
jgi:hypothetical protein